MFDVSMCYMHFDDALGVYYSEESDPGLFWIDAYDIGIRPRGAQDEIYQERTP